MHDELGEPDERPRRARSSGPGAPAVPSHAAGSRHASAIAPILVASASRRAASHGPIPTPGSSSPRASAADPTATTSRWSSRSATDQPAHGVGACRPSSSVAVTSAASGAAARARSIGRVLMGMGRPARARVIGRSCRRARGGLTAPLLAGEGSTPGVTWVTSEVPPVRGGDVPTTVTTMSSEVDRCPTTRDANPRLPASGTTTTSPYARATCTAWCEAARLWARQQGLPVPTNGPLPHEVMAQYKRRQTWE